MRVRAARRAAAATSSAAPRGPCSTPTGLVGAAVEAAWVTTHLALYPLGAASAATARDSQHGYRVEHLPPVQRGLLISDVEAAGTPILLVHGMVDNRSIFTLLRRGPAPARVRAGHDA